MSESYQNRLKRVKEAIIRSDAILIGGGAGLSTAAGLEYSGRRFTKNFPDFIAKYHLTDMYSSMFYHFKTLEERWAYVSRHTMLNRYSSPVGKPYTDLKKITENRNHFILTTNGDAQFERAGFNTNRIFATQGDYSVFQCEKPCSNTLYPNEEAITAMVTQQKDCRIPAELIPVCPKCGRGLVPHLRIDDTFVENEDWHEASRRYTEFVKRNIEKKLVLMEIGVGYNTPGIIKYPFEQITGANPNATLIRINKDYPEVSKTNRSRTIAFSEDTQGILDSLLEVSIK